MPEETSRLGRSERCVNFVNMTLKQQIHDLVDRLPDDSQLLVEVRESLQMNHAIGAAMKDVREGRTFGPEEFMAKVEERWPSKSSV